MNLPPYNTYPNIGDDRVLLRQIMYSDIPALVDISFYDGVQAIDVAQATSMHEQIIDDYTNGESIHWAIVDKATNTVVGTCGFYCGLANGIGEVGCVLLPAHRGHGYMTHAMKLSVDFGLKTMGLTRIIAITTPQNDRALKLLSRTSFTRKTDLENDKVEFEINAQ